LALANNAQVHLAFQYSMPANYQLPISKKIHLTVNV